MNAFSPKRNSKYDFFTKIFNEDPMRETARFNEFPDTNKVSSPSYYDPKPYSKYNPIPIFRLGKCKTLVHKVFPKDFFELSSSESEALIPRTKEIGGRVMENITENKSALIKRKLVLTTSRECLPLNRNRVVLLFGKASTFRDNKVDAITKPKDNEHEDSLLSFSKFLPVPQVINSVWTKPAILHKEAKFVLPDVFTKKVKKIKGYYDPSNKIYQGQRFTSYDGNQELSSSEASLPFKSGERNELQLSMSTESESKESARLRIVKR